MLRPGSRRTSLGSTGRCGSRRSTASTGSSWLERFCHRLLEGSPAVLDLLAVNPFPDAPPRFVRVVRSQYHVAPLDVHRRERVWWTREEPQPYSPVMSLSENDALTTKELMR